MLMQPANEIGAIYSKHAHHSFACDVEKERERERESTQFPAATLYISSLAEAVVQHSTFKFTCVWW